MAASLLTDARVDRPSTDILRSLLEHIVSPVDSRSRALDHKRETIAFGRRLESILGRVLLAAVWNRRTPAMMLELTELPWDWPKLLRQRLFAAREPISAPWRELYRRTWSPGLPIRAAKHAF